MNDYDELPPMPEPPSYESAHDDAPLTDHYSADQMRQYGLACRQKALEDAASIALQEGAESAARYIRTLDGHRCTRSHPHELMNENCQKQTAEVRAERLGPLTEARAALTCASNILFLLSDHVAALGHRASNVKQMLEQALERLNNLTRLEADFSFDSGRTHRLVLWGSAEHVECLQVWLRRTAEAEAAHD